MVRDRAEERVPPDNEVISESNAADKRSRPVVALLEDHVRTELQVTNGIFDLGLSDETIERLMQGATSGPVRLRP